MFSWEIMAIPVERERSSRALPIALIARQIRRKTSQQLFDRALIEFRTNQLRRVRFMMSRKECGMNKVRRWLVERV
jgi:hypothetical protein